MPKNILGFQGLEVPSEAWLLSLPTRTSIQVSDEVLGWVLTLSRLFGWKELRGEVSAQAFQAELLSLSHGALW